ncbi:CLIP domain-containing serine protease B15-like isoform X2 [Topomyia yanbarensis]|uniref:CLIP domain-containing serine protease B15-like isoform X2 n=1 Tax=Topomyia yanbarensis TaxID=2498891 RepID=UPI00273B8914|nr:CLIP domain-containing serine protease B15-like isoform X2 [Topomyia yanbarensis]
MMKWWFFIIILKLQSDQVRSTENETCTTSSRRIGRCKLVKDCEFVKNILHSPNPTHEEWYYLDHNMCGKVSADLVAKPLICCPEIHNVPECGVSKIANRIFGGNEAVLGEIPWAGVIVYRISKKRLSVKCGCSLLNSRWALTAAHCINDVPSSWRIHQVRFSEWNILKISRCTVLNDMKICRQEYSIERAIVHPLYQTTSANMRHDIALLKTEKEVQFTDYVIPICLPYSEEVREMPISQQNFTVTGWGQTDKGNIVGVQRHVVIAGQDNSVCDRAFSSLNITLSEEQICAGGESGQDSCRGDSGGPLTLQDGLVNYQIGVVSFGALECGTKNSPGIYTNVIQYLDWIEEVMMN